MWWFVLSKTIGGFTGGVPILDNSWRYNINSGGINIKSVVIQESGRINILIRIINRIAIQ